MFCWLGLGVLVGWGVCLVAGAMRSPVVLAPSRLAGGHQLVLQVESLLQLDVLLHHPVQHVLDLASADRDGPATVEHLVGGGVISNQRSSGLVVYWPRGLVIEQYCVCWK